MQKKQPKYKGKLLDQHYYEKYEFKNKLFRLKKV